MAQAAAAADLNDVKYDAFLANDRTLADPEIIKVEPGTVVLLRVINGSSMSNYHLDLGRLKGELIAVDGSRSCRWSGRSFPINDGPAARYPRCGPPRAGGQPDARCAGRRAASDRYRAGCRLGGGCTHPQYGGAASAASRSASSAACARQPLTPRKADREHTLNLTGDMAVYRWSSQYRLEQGRPPLPIAKGERVELVMINRTGMSHPMHLHGHPFQIVEIDGKRFAGAIRDTVLVPPGRRVVVAFDPTIRGFGPSTAICSTISTPACSPRCGMSDDGLQ